MARRFKVGDPVIYRKQKMSPHPGPNAFDITPTPCGEDYNYQVDKFWRVVAILPDNLVEICTRRGKRHTLPDSDPALRPAAWWERLLYRHRFPDPVLLENQPRT